MPSRQAEQNANNALGALLNRMLPTCAVRVENTRVIVGQSGLQLDILITAHDLTGRIFQRLIADRKYLATFYTLPASAALLARLAVAKMDVDWSDADAIASLRIGDFACGTGALLSAVYDQVAARHERAGGDSAHLHTAMMEEVLYGCDVMPSAIHITGSTLSGMHPNVGFGQSRLYTMPYIADADPNRALLDKRVVCDLLGFGQDTYEAVRRLSAKWCAEPSVHGGKRRPRGAGLVM